MREPTYRQIGHAAWQLVARRPVLWVLGLLAVLVGQFGLGNFVGKLLVWSEPERLRQSLWWWTPFWSRLVNAGSLLWVVWLLLIGVGVAAFILVVGIGAQGALIAATAEWWRHHTPPKIGPAWHRGVKHFWRLLVINVVMRGGLLVLLALALLFWFGADSALRPLDWLGLVIWLALIFFLGLAWSVVGVYAAGAVVEDEAPLPAAVGGAWRLFVNHPVVAIELSLLMLLINVVAYAAVLAASLLVLMPSLVVWLLAGALNSPDLWALGVWFALSAFMVVVALVGGIINAFVTATWMYAFMKLRHEGLVSRAVSWVERVARR